MMREFAEAVGCPAPQLEPFRLVPGEALAWFRRESRPPVRLRIAPSRSEHRRHTRKYAEGDLGTDRSCYFRGPDGRLNLRAQNLILFLQLADGVDDGTWLHHLRRGDYSHWVRECIKDDHLAEQIAGIEEREPICALESRRLIRDAIEERYTLPASASPRGAARSAGNANRLQ